MDESSFNRLLGQAYWGAAGEVLGAVDADRGLAARAGRGGETLLHHAAMGRHAELVRGLLQRGADPKTKNDHGHDALKFAQGDATVTGLLSGEPAAVLGGASGGRNEA